MNSREFIFSVLNKGVSENLEAALGIRHTVAIVSVVYLSLILHLQNNFNLKFVFFFIMCIYLIIFPLSRSTWLAGFLSIFAISWYFLSDNIERFFVKLVILVGAVSVVVILISIMTTNTSIFEFLFDRLTDSASMDGRLNSASLSSLSVDEFILGTDNYDAMSPHNIVLDSILHGGLISVVVSLIAFGTALRLYLVSFYLYGRVPLIIASYSSAAVVRMLTAGGGLPHIGELFGLFVSLEIFRRYRANGTVI